MFSDLLSRVRSGAERSPGVIQMERGLLLFVCILLVGTVGYEVIGGFDPVQALYMTIITIFSVGYGDPGVDTPAERFFTMGLILSGTTIGLYIAGGFIRIIAEGEINKVVGKLMKTRNIEGLNVFITLTARNLKSQLRIIARGEQPSTQRKLEQAGADEVVLPAAIGALRMAESVIRPTLVELFGDSKRMGDLSNDFSALGLEIDELSLNERDAFVGHSIREFEQDSQANFIVLAIRRKDGTILQHPPHDARLQEGDNLIILSSPDNITPSLSRHARKRELL